MENEREIIEIVKIYEPDSYSGTKEQEHDMRRIFVLGLGKFLGQLRQDIEMLSYRCESRKEFVTIHYMDGAKRTVPITCDSFRGIIMDVVSRI